MQKQCGLRLKLTEKSVSIFSYLIYIKLTFSVLFLLSSTYCLAPWRRLACYLKRNAMRKENLFHPQMAGHQPIKNFSLCRYQILQLCSYVGHISHKPICYVNVNDNFTVTVKGSTKPKHIWLGQSSE